MEAAQPGRLLREGADVVRPVGRNVYGGGIIVRPPLWPWPILSACTLASRSRCSLRQLHPLATQCIGACDVAARAATNLVVVHRRRASCPLIAQVSLACRRRPRALRCAQRQPDLKNASGF